MVGSRRVPADRNAALKLAVPPMWNLLRRYLALLLALLALAIMTFWWNYRNTLINFTDEDRPIYTGSYAPVPPSVGDSLKVISWNTKFANQVDAAIEELQRVEELQGADIILLQEMDNEGVERIARELAYNYVYYPASIHNRTGRAFGNAVLSRWPIQDSVKVLLPHASPSNRQRRIAVGSVLDIGGQEVVAYSVHTETPILSSSKREEQIAHLGELVGVETPECVIVGGDFNTFSPGSSRVLEEMMRAVGLSPVFGERPATLKTPLIRFNLDHLFVRGFEPTASGVWSGTAASDHHPIWTMLDACVTLAAGE